MKKNILLLCTGGTIASSKGVCGLTPGLDGEDILRYIPAAEDFCHIEVLEICKIDSTNMTPVHWRIIMNAVKDNYDKYDGFVILHGTDTMAYTAAALSYMIQNSRKPIVFTGSQKPISQDITDARKNLIDSVFYACDDQSCGVTVVFHGIVIAGTRAKKIRAHSYDAFTSVNFPVLASVHDGHLIRFIPQGNLSGAVRFQEAMNDSIAVLKLIPGSRPGLLEYLFEHYDCLVIESFGLGGIPESIREEFYAQMRYWESRGKAVVIATQVMNEGSDMEVYEVGQQVKKDFHLLETYDMTLEAAVTKMMHLMALYPGDNEAVRENFYHAVNYDILYRQSVDAGHRMQDSVLTV